MRRGCDKRGGLSVKRTMLFFVVAALMALMTTIGAFEVSAQEDTGLGNDTNQPENGPSADNQSQGPPCGHDWCDWYQVCRWEYWAWDHDKGWTLVHTDGYCDTSG